MKKIIINGRFLTSPMTGINRFAYELVKQLNQLRVCEIIVPYGSVLKDQYDLKGLNIIEYGKMKSHLWEQWSLWRYVRKNRGCVLLSLSGIGPLLYRNKVITIHDLSFLANPRWFSKRYYLIYKFLTPLAIRTSKLILTVSKFSKSELVHYYRIDENKIKVVYNAVSPKKNSIKKSENKNSDYILTVGSLDPRKNLKILIEAFTDERLKNFKLHVVGSSNKAFRSFRIDESNMTNIKMLGHISDEELTREYQGAKMFICPSLYEGFGIPPLEALNHHVPIVISDIPVFREIYEGVPHYFNPLSKEAIINTILNQQANNTFDEVETNRILSKFSWTASAGLINDSINNL